MSARHGNYLVVLVGVLALTACMHAPVSSLFSHYSASLQQVRRLTQAGDYQQALHAVPDAPFGALLDSLERGRVAFLAGDLSVSGAAWQQADALISAQQDKAMISLSAGLSQASAVLVNDNALGYVPSDYELGFLHLYRALQFLRASDLSAALVEVRRANQVQEQARKTREQALLDAESTLQRDALYQTTNIGAVLARYPHAGNQVAAVQNGYLFYLSALLYEMENNGNSAFIDYSRALAVAAENPHVAQALMRLANAQGRRKALRTLEQQYGKWVAPKQGEGQLVILQEQGVVAAKSAWQLPFFYAAAGYQANGLYVSLPHYAATEQLANASALQVNGRAVTPLLLTNVDKMAKQSLAEQMPVMVTRQVLRLIAKWQLIELAAQKDPTGLGQLAASLYSAVTEQPDTRSWQTLPERVSLYSHYYPGGTYEVVVQGRVLPVEIKPNRTTLLWLSTQGQHVAHWQTWLGEL